MNVQKVTQEYRLDYWSGIISECRNSKQTVLSWCDENNVNSKSYYYWLRKVRAAACNSLPATVTKSQQIVPLNITSEAKPSVTENNSSPSSTAQAAVILRLNSAILEIQNGASFNAIENTLKALKNLC